MNWAAYFHPFSFLLNGWRMNKDDDDDDDDDAHNKIEIM